MTQAAPQPPRNKIVKSLFKAIEAPLDDEAHFKSTYSKFNDELIAENEVNGVQAQPVWNTIKNEFNSIDNLK